jgi:DNA polymerase-3 subunit beta
MKITIDHNIVKALLICAAKQDIRYYLKGVLVDARASDVTLVTTDGHRLLAYPVAVDAIEALAPGQYIIPREALEAVKPAKAGRVTLPITIEIDTAKGLENKITGATSVVTPLIDGKFPDWRRVLPKTVSGEPAQYQAEYLGDFGRIADLLGTKYPHIHHNGSSAAIVGNLGAALGVLMPMRSDAEFSALPAWALA